MSADDVWSSGDEELNTANPSFGAYGAEGALDVNTAFSIDSVVRYGTAVLQEQPVMSVLGGVNLFVLTLMISGLSFVLNLGLIAMGTTGEISPEVADMLAQASGAVLQIFAWPFQQLVMAGMMVAGALYITRDTVSVGALYSSIRAAVRALLASLAAGFISLAVTGLTMAPALVAAVWFASQENFESAMVAGLVLFLPAFPILVYVGIGLMLTPYAAVLDHAGPIEAVGVSWEMAAGARVTLFITSFVFAILGVISACMCSVPLVILIPIQVMGFTAGYLRARRSEATAAAYPFFERTA